MSTEIQRNLGTSAVNNTLSVTTETVLDIGLASIPNDTMMILDDRRHNVSIDNYSQNTNFIVNTSTEYASTFSPHDRSMSADEFQTFSAHDPLGLASIVGLSFLFFVIILIGIVGNALVIFVVLTDRKMRQSVTNLLILNLAAADLVIMMLGVPEIVQFMLDEGWLLGPVPCRLDRFLLVVCLYASVLSLVSVCIERY